MVEEGGKRMAAEPGGWLAPASSSASGCRQAGWLPAAGREEQLGELASGGFDLVVVGAGANGLAAARDAVLRGYRTIVVERDDVGAGTTRWSGRQVHGGLRYLEHGEIGLVRESLAERETLLRCAPHLVRRSRVLLPAYRGARRRPLTLRAGTLCYDALIADRPHPWRQWERPGEARRHFGRLRESGLAGAVRYSDALLDWPERLCVDLARDVVSFGGVLLTHARVESLLVVGGRVRGVGVVDAVGGGHYEVGGSVVVNAAGPWADSVVAGAGPSDARLVGGTKGSHLLIDRFEGAPDEVVYAEHPDDGRLASIVPLGDGLLVGSTDMAVDGDPDEVDTDPGEVDYLLRFVDWLAPGAAGEARIRLCYCAVRPLPFSPGTPEGSITRRSLVVDHAPRLPGLVTLVGGKLTTHRHTGELLVDKAEEVAGWAHRPPATRGVPLHGARGGLSSALEPLLGRTSAARLAGLYGTAASELAGLARAWPELAAPLDEPTGALAAEAVHAVESEGAGSLDDLLWRRLVLGLQAPERVEQIARRTVTLLEETGHLARSGVEAALSGARAAADALVWPRRPAGVLGEDHPAGAGTDIDIRQGART